VKFGGAVFELRERTDRQTDMSTHHNTSQSWGMGNVTNEFCYKVG